MPWIIGALVIGTVGTLLWFIVFGDEPPDDKDDGRSRYATYVRLPYE